MKNGVHFNLPREQYDRLQRTNWSNLKIMDRSPAHFRHNQLEGRPDTDAMKMGRCTHLAVFEPEAFSSGCVLWDGGIRRGKVWDSFRKRYAGAEILTETEHARCLAIGAAVRADAQAAKYLAGGKGEATILWTYEAPAVGGLEGYSIECKSRVDFVAEVGALVDLKTTRDASPSGFGRESWRLCYHGQAAIYSDAYFSVTGRRIPYVMVAVESSPPYAVQVYRVPEAAILLGREHYRAMMDRLALCRSESRWPAYSEEEMELPLPRWAIGENEDEDLTGLDLVINQEAANGL